MNSQLRYSCVLRWSALAFAALLASCATPPAKPPTATSSMTAATGKLRIATWNLEHLAEPDDVGCRPRKPVDYARMRDYVAKVDADVFAFEEVESAAAAQRVFTPDKYTVVFEQRPVSGGRARECRGEPGLYIRNQGVGFAIRNGVAFERNADLAALGLGDPNLRWGVDITVRDRADQPLRLLAVHLKSGCFDKNDPTPVCSTVFKQADALQQWVAAREGEQVRYAILGDWNRRLGKPDDKLWWELRHSTSQGVMLKDIPGARRPRCSTYDSYIDHIVLAPRTAAGYLAESFVEHTYERSGQPAHLSDHCAISIDLTSS